MPHYPGYFGREDLRPEVISDARFDVTRAPGPAFAVLRRGHADFRPEARVVVGGVAAAEADSKP